MELLAPLPGGDWVLIGGTLQHYKIVKQLGRGGMGEVYGRKAAGRQPREPVERSRRISPHRLTLLTDWTRKLAAR